MNCCNLRAGMVTRGLAAMMMVLAVMGSGEKIRAALPPEDVTYMLEDFETGGQPGLWTGRPEATGAAVR